MNFKIIIFAIYLFATSLAFSAEGESVLTFTTNLKVTTQKSFRLKGKEAFINGQLLAKGALGAYQAYATRVLMIKPDGTSQCNAGSYVHQVSTDKNGKKKMKVARGCLTSKAFAELIQAFTELEKAYRAPH